MAGKPKCEKNPLFALHKNYRPWIGRFPWTAGAVKQEESNPHLFSVVRQTVK